MESIDIADFIDDFSMLLCDKMDYVMDKYNTTKDKKYLELYQFYAVKLVKSVKDRRYFSRPIFQAESITPLSEPI